MTTEEILKAKEMLMIVIREKENDSNNMLMSSKFNATTYERLENEIKLLKDNRDKLTVWFKQSLTETWEKCGLRWNEEKDVFENIEK